jgi:membrane protein implicated in regulation of membrane protease activity
MRVDRLVLLFTLGGLVMLWLGDAFIHSPSVTNGLPPGNLWPGHEWTLRSLGLLMLCAMGIAAVRILRRRAESQGALQRRAASMEALTAFAAELMHAHNWRDVTAHGLEELGRSEEVDGVFVWEYRHEPTGSTRVERHFSWVTENAPAEDDTGWRRAEGTYAASMEIHERGETIHGPVRVLEEAGYTLPETEKALSLRQPCQS